MKVSPTKAKAVFFESAQDLILYSNFHKKCQANDRTMLSVFRRAMFAYLNAEDVPPIVEYTPAPGREIEN